MAKYMITVEPLQPGQVNPATPEKIWRWEVREKFPDRDAYGKVQAYGTEDTPEKAELRARSWASALSKKKIIIWDSEASTNESPTES